MTRENSYLRQVMRENFTHRIVVQRFQQILGGLQSINSFLTLVLWLTAVMSIAQTPDANGIVYVTETATGDGNGNSWDSATDNLHNAIHADGVQKVFVASGTYKVGAHSFEMKNGVEIYGGFDPQNNIRTLNDARILPNKTASEGSVLDGEYVRPVIWNYNNGITTSAVLDGFTITNGKTTDRGGGIYNLSASPTLRNLVVKNNAASMGGGIYNENNSNAVLVDIIVTGNTVNSLGIIATGGGICSFTSNPVITNAVIANNNIVASSGSSLGGGVYNRAGKMVITNSVVDNNTVPQSGGGIFNDGAEMVLTNVTVADNKSTSAAGQGSGTGGIVSANGSTLAIYNSIIWGNQQNGSATTTGADILNSGIGSTIVLKNSSTQSYTTGVSSDNNIIGDPLFTDTDFELQSTSPVINKGNNALYVGLNAETRDLAGNARVYNYANKGLIDLGAYESSYNSPLAADAAGIIYVKTTAVTTGNGSDWDNATDDLQGAINTANVQKVFVAIGNYNVPSPNSFVMKNGVEIYGGFDPENNIRTPNDARILPNHGKSEGSVLNGKNERSVIWNNNIGLTEAAVLDGFTIKNGYADTNGAGIYNSNASPTLTNLAIKENVAGNGAAGIFNTSSSPVVTNVVVSGNTATNNGGGIVNVNSSPVFTNTSITQNSAGSSGGGLFQLGTGSVVLNNVTIAGNTPNAVNVNTGNLFFNNSVIYGGVVGTYTAQYSLIEGSTGGASGNLDGTARTAAMVFADPLSGNYALHYNSAAIDAGNSLLFPGLDANSKDLVNNPRIDKASIDLGAYEFTLIPDGSGVVYVRQDFSGSGSSWADATGGLQRAIDAAGTLKVFVAVGEYKVGDHSFIMKDDVEIYGGFDPVNGITNLTHNRVLPNHGVHDGSVLNGENTRPVIWNDNNGVSSSGVLDGFTVKNGNNNNAGGVYNASVSPVYKNLVIRDNQGGFGGGVYNTSSSPVFINVIITGNSAQYGSAMFNHINSSITATNVQITDNISSLGYEAAVHNADGYHTFTNVTIANNTPNALYINQGTGFYFKNSIVYGGIYRSTPDGAPEVGYIAESSLIEGNANISNGNLNATGLTLSDIFTNPSAGRYTLKTGSVAINAGDNELFPDLEASSKDLAGNLRLIENQVDLGAYENPNGVLPVRWISFEGKLNDQYQAVLAWRVDQTSVSGYQIERSSNARDFRIIGSVSASGDGISQYSFTDPVAAVGAVYYRIRQTDLDGSFSYSRLISLTGPQDVPLMAYPNPVSDQVMVRIGAEYIGTSLRLVNVAGVQLQQLTAEQEILTLKLYNYTAGTYILYTWDGKAVKLFKN
jgi:hypothetical protein